MAVRIVRLGSPRANGEGLRIGTVRRPPRGVAKAELSARDFYDVWLPKLAPSEQLLKLAKGAGDERGWRSFARRYRAEMQKADARRVLDLLAALSHTTDYSVGCYCRDEQRCHRSLLQRASDGAGGQARVVTPAREHGLAGWCVQRLRSSGTC